MALRRDRPLSFKDAIETAQIILSSSQALVEKGTIESEAIQLVQAAYRSATNRELSRLDLFTQLRESFPAAAGDRLLILATTRAEGKPLQHLVGYQTFLDHEYEVGPDVLIPRPETEGLVVLVQDYLLTFDARSILGIEVGVGSGAISIELLASYSSLRMTASDLQPHAIARAHKNADRILGTGAHRLALVQAQSVNEVFEPFLLYASGAYRNQVDFIVSNPPYLSQADSIEDEVRYFEPVSALYAPESDLLYFYRKIAQGAAQILKPGGAIFLEIPHERADLIQHLFRSSPWCTSKIHFDLAGRPRVLVASLA